ncbi:MAG TPA: replication-relaxation family protein, partial [Gemmataceae bacterium]|nr:replication-relaxation family protein [Gemmataceae bacterium]
MQITPRVISILEFVAVCYTATREMIQRACLSETDPKGRIARKLLNAMHAESLLNKTQQLVCNPNWGAPAPVYYPSRKGCELLAVETGDDKWMNTCCLCPNWQHLHHWVNVAKFHFALLEAVKLVPSVKIDGWLSEWDIANPAEKEPHLRYRLFTEIRKEPRLVCAPDAAFLLRVGSLAKVFYVEIDRATTSINAIAASKTGGFAEMARQLLHKRHYPKTTFDTFSVLQITTSPNRRDALVRAIKTKPGAEIWRFIAWPEITRESLIHGDIVYDCQNEKPRALVKKASAGESGTGPAGP